MVGFFITLEELLVEMPFQNFQCWKIDLCNRFVHSFNSFLQRLAVLPENKIHINFFKLNKS